MKDLHIALASNRVQKNDGQGRVNYEIALAALERGYRLTVLASRCAPEIAQHPLARHIHIDIEKLPTQLLRNDVFARKTANWLKANRSGIDIVQANGFTTWERCDVVAAHFVHGAWRKNSYYPYTNPWKSLYKSYHRTYTALNERWEYEAFAGAKVVVAVSKQVAGELESIGIPAEKIKVIYNGVDTSEFSPGPPDRASFKLPENVPLALFAGDLRTTRKNLDTVLRSFQKLPETHLAVAGDLTGSPFPALAETLGISQRVHFLGRISDMPALMRAVDLFVFPTRYDPLGLVILEAMATGIPVITSSKAGGSELLGDGGRILENPDDTEMLTQWLAEMLGSRDLRRQMGAAGRERALANGWRLMGEQYLQLYESLTGS